MKYALIGCGRIATNHIKAVLNNHLEFAAVCDVVPQQMENLLAKHELNHDASIHRYTDYKEMIEKEQPELVGIATESGVHAEIALYCIDHGVNVIIEKPMAMSIADAEEIIRRSEEKGVKVSACHQNRFNVAVQQMRKALEAGRFGKLSHGSIHVRWNRNRDYYDQAKWRGTWAQDGGALMNQCIHGIDLLRWMMGGEIDEVYGVTRQQFHHYLEAEDIGMAVVKFKNGAVATIEGTTNVYPKNLEETLYLFGENGTVKPPTTLMFGILRMKVKKIRRTKVFRKQPATYTATVIPACMRMLSMRLSMTANHMLTHMLAEMLWNWYLPSTRARKKASRLNCL